jgi:hypothetical protein
MYAYKRMHPNCNCQCHISKVAAATYPLPEMATLCAGLVVVHTGRQQQHATALHNLLAPSLDAVTSLQAGEGNRTALRAAHHKHSSNIIEA